MLSTSRPQDANDWDDFHTFSLGPSQVWKALQLSKINEADVCSENDTVALVMQFNSWLSVRELCSHKLIKGMQSLLLWLVSCDDWHSCYLLAVTLLDGEEPWETFWGSTPLLLWRNFFWSQRFLEQPFGRGCLRNPSESFILLLLLEPEQWTYCFCRHYYYSAHWTNFEGFILLENLRKFAQTSESK